VLARHFTKKLFPDPAEPFIVVLRGLNDLATFGSAEVAHITHSLSFIRTVINTMSWSPFAIDR
jgi:hypothetical protein